MEKERKKNGKWDKERQLEGEKEMLAYKGKQNEGRAPVRVGTFQVGSTY